MKISFPTLRYALLFLMPFIALLPMPALAYFGPGGGLTAIGALLALIGIVFFTFFGFIWFPLKRLIKKLKNGKKDDGSNTDESDH